MTSDLYKITACVDMCTKFDLPKVKVAIIFLGAVDFSLRRDRLQFSTVALSDMWLGSCCAFQTHYSPLNSIPLALSNNARS